MDRVLDLFDLNFSCVGFGFANFGRIFGFRNTFNKSGDFLFRNADL